MSSAHLNLASFLSFMFYFYSIFCFLGEDYFLLYLIYLPCSTFSTFDYSILYCFLGGDNFPSICFDFSVTFSYFFIYSFFSYFLGFGGEISFFSLFSWIRLTISWFTLLGSSCWLFDTLLYWKTTFGFRKSVLRTVWTTGLMYY